ncbi:52 kDa repressor of the inhibitor of the protein kinase [Collichthys lucidus]|uniref:52 kDa repressor of the inhibitor of the protein kinase n=1 Tax=Collichthys lucidus TaxID=240159 RepID=A0A4U5V7U8_COLLU|nr:52 kDa repressor of the inhibitor of the protein kinase [Collichthys lucidus]
MQNRCAVPSCTGTKPDSQPLFRFPHDPERSKKWVEKCQRPDLKDKSPDQLYRYYRLCGKHFEPSLIQSETQSAVLKDDAIPTIFDAPSQPQNVQVKRSKETTKDDETESTGRKKLKKSQAETAKDDVQPLSEEEEYKEYLKSLFEVLILLGEQSIPPTGPGDKKDGLGSTNFQALLEYRINCGDDALIKSLTASGRGLSDSCPLRRRRRLSKRLLSEMTDKWGLDMGQCRGQAHSCSGTHLSKIKTFAAKLMEKYPKAVLAIRSTRTFNVSLANGMALSGVQLVMSTLKKIESFFSQSTLLQLELEHAISIFYPDKEEKAKELKEICQSSWTRRHDVFDVAVDILEALLLCVDSVHDNEDMRWNDQVTHNALEISKALADFEFVMALIVLKNTMILTRAFGKNVQGTAADVHFAATSLKALLHSLKEVSDNIDVYHEFWNDEAVNLATAMEIPVEVPRSFLRKNHVNSGAIRPESYYKEHLSVPIANHIIKEMNELFCEDHLKALRCLSLVPAVIEQHRSTEPEEECVQVFKDDIPNAGSLSAELHCWWVKWSKKGKGETFASSLHETLQLADVKFFPNMLAVLRLIGVLPTLALEDGCDVAYKRFQMYMANTPDEFKSKSLALLNVNYDVGYNLDAIVDVYMKTYPDREETS